MVEAVLGLLAFAVFGLLWVANQDWFDLLPRTLARRFSAGAFVVLVGTCWLAPSAFQSGFRRFTNYLSSKITRQLHEVLGHLVPVPTSTPTPTPTSTPVPTPPTGHSHAP